MQKSTQAYELTFILGEKATLEQATEKVAQLTAFLAGHDGSVTRQELWGRRELAYLIKRNRSGFYTTLWFDLPPLALKELEEHLRFDEQVIRSLITKAYTTAVEGSLYPQPEEEQKPARRADEKATGEETIRRNSKAPKPEADEAVVDVELDEEEVLPEEERLKQLDETLDELLKEAPATQE